MENILKYNNLFQKDKYENKKNYNNINNVYEHINYIHQILDSKYHFTNGKDMKNYINFLNELINNDTLKNNIYLNYNSEIILINLNIIYQCLYELFEDIKNKFDDKIFYKYCSGIINLLEFENYLDNESKIFIFENINLILIYLMNLSFLCYDDIFQYEELRNLIMYKIIYFI